MRRCQLVTSHDIRRRYAGKRQSVSRIAGPIDEACEQAWPVLDVVAKAGSHEPVNSATLEVELLGLIRRERPVETAFVLRDFADHLPDEAWSRDAEKALPIVHHLRNFATVPCSIAPVAGKRIALLTWGPVRGRLWPKIDYFPDIACFGRRKFSATHALAEWIERSAEDVPMTKLTVQQDCIDSFVYDNLRKQRCLIDPVLFEPRRSASLVAWARPHQKRGGTHGTSGIRTGRHDDDTPPDRSSTDCKTIAARRESLMWFGEAAFNMAIKAFAKWVAGGLGNAGFGHRSAL